jgi:hypothetical protein
MEPLSPSGGDEIQISLRSDHVTNCLCCGPSGWNQVLAARQWKLVQRTSFGPVLLYKFAVRLVGNAYEDIINTTHEHFWGHHSNAHRMWCVRDRIPQDIRGHFFSLQKNAVLLLYVVGLALATLQLVLEWELWRRSHYLYRPPLIMAAIMLLALGWIFSANLRGLRQRSNIECKPSPFIPLF